MGRCTYYLICGEGVYPSHAECNAQASYLWEIFCSDDGRAKKSIASAFYGEHLQQMGWEHGVIIGIDRHMLSYAKHEWR